MNQVLATLSTRPYLIRAIYEWCTDNGFTPYITVQVDDQVQVPLEYVHGGEIVLNVSFDATSKLDMGNDYIKFQARFAGTVRDIMVPVDHVTAIYARENRQGMFFPAPVQMQAVAESAAKALDALVAQEETTPEQVAESGRRHMPDGGLHLVDDAHNTGSSSPEEDIAPDPDDDPPPKDGNGQGGKPALRIVK